jgi:PEP-CTERM motif
MTFVTRMASATAIGAAVLIGLIAPSAEAGYVVDLTQQGPNVVATGSGPIDLSDLTLVDDSGNASSNPEMTPNGGDDPFNMDFLTGPSRSAIDIYEGLTGPASFGNGTGAGADSGSGDFVGMTGAVQLYVPHGYVSDSPLSDSATYLSQTFSSLGVTPGTYKWAWGDGANQNFTLVIGTVVPEPSTWAMMLLGFLGLGFMGYQSGRNRTARNV